MADAKIFLYNTDRGALTGIININSASSLKPWYFFNRHHLYRLPTTGSVMRRSRTPNQSQRAKSTPAHSSVTLRAKRIALRLRSCASVTE